MTMQESYILFYFIAAFIFLHSTCSDGCAMDLQLHGCKFNSIQQYDLTFVFCDRSSDVAVVTNFWGLIRLAKTGKPRLRLLHCYFTRDWRIVTPMSDMTWQIET